MAEARKLGIKVVALLDTDCDPDTIDLPIPSNDDSMRSIELVLTRLTEAIIEGKAAAPPEPPPPPRARDAAIGIEAIEVIEAAGAEDPGQVRGRQGRGDGLRGPMKARESEPQAAPTAGAQATVDAKHLGRAGVHGHAGAQSRRPSRSPRRRSSEPTGRGRTRRKPVSSPSPSTRARDFDDRDLSSRSARPSPADRLARRFARTGLSARSVRPISPNGRLRFAIWRGMDRPIAPCGRTSTRSHADGRDHGSGCQ